MSHLLLPIPLLLLPLSAQYALANTNNCTKDNGGDFDIYTKLDILFSIIFIISIVIISVYIFDAIVNIYCRSSRSSEAFDHFIYVGPPDPVPFFSPSGQEIRSGPNPAAADAFPILTYSVAAAALNVSMESLECTICLSDFAEDDSLRLLPSCGHVFHPECLGPWLECRATCPICRDNLAVEPTEKPAGPSDLEMGRIGGSHLVSREMSSDGRHRLVLPEHVVRELVESYSLRRSEEMVVVDGCDSQRGDALGESRALEDRSVRKAEVDEETLITLSSLSTKLSKIFLY